MKRNNSAIHPSCALCKHATFRPTEGHSPMPPLLFSLSANITDEEITINCPYKKNISPAFSCRRFCFDPLKYRPKKAPLLSPLDEDTLLLE